MVSVIKRKKDKMRSMMKGSNLQRLKASNQEGKTLTDEDLDNLVKDLYESTVEGFTQELKKVSPAQQKLAKESSGLISEFFAGLKEGMEAELEVIKQEHLTVKESAFDSPKEDTENETVDLLKRINEQLATLNSNAKKAGLSKEEIAAAKKQSREILDRPTEASYTEKIPFAARAKQVGVGLMFGALGLDKIAMRKIDKIQRQEEFIKTESALRSEKDESFAKLSEKEKRSALKESFSAIESETKRLRDIETRAEKLRERGYSEEQIEQKLGLASQRSEILSTISKHDTSRNSNAFETNTANRNSSSINNSNTSTNFYSTDASSTSRNDINNSSVPNNSIVKNNSVTTSFLEEKQSEETLAREKELEVDSDQLSVLQEIRDIIKNWKKDITGKETQPENAPKDSIVDKITDAIDLGKDTLKRKTGTAKNILKSLMSPKAGAALAIGAGTYEAYTGYQEADVNKQNALKRIDEQLVSGAITKEEAAKQKSIIESQATEDKGGALGKGTGIAAGAIGGGIAGAKLGMLFGPAGAAIGGFGGSIIGGIAGSSVGQNIGGLAGRGIEYIKSGLGFGAPTIGGEQQKQTFEEAEFARTNPAGYQQFLAYRDQRTSQLIKEGNSKEVAVATATKESIEKFISKNSENKLNENTTNNFISKESIVSNNSSDKLTENLKSEMFAVSRSASDLSKYVNQRNDISSLKETSLQSETKEAPKVIVNAPPATVIPAPPQQEKVIQQPFFQRMRNQETSLNDYLRTRYA